MPEEKGEGPAVVDSGGGGGARAEVAQLAFSFGLLCTCMQHMHMFGISMFILSSGNRSTGLLSIVVWATTTGPWVIHTSISMQASQDHGVTATNYVLLG
jgi:hypothetical protein